MLMDQARYSSVWLALALLQGVLILTAFNVRRVRRTPVAAAGGLSGPAAQTQRRWRSMQVSSTSPPSRCHQFAAEKISTSL
jgi:hypothetical protein